MTIDHWKNLIIGIIIILFVLTFFKFVLGYSMKENVKLLFSEFRDLLSVKVTSKSINAASIICCCIISLTHMLAATAKEVFYFSQSKSTNITIYDPIVYIITIAVFAVICIRLLPESK